MTKFKKIFIFSCFVLALATLAAPLITSAVAAPGDTLNRLKEVGGEAYGTGTEAPRSVTEIVGGIIKTGLSVLGIVAAILIIYAGYVWMTARGKEERINKAKETLEAAIIGLIIIMAAYAITYFVVDRLLTASGSPTASTTPPPATP
ncbi:MAG: pilin [Patescibacteria group bacterium]